MYTVPQPASIEARLIETQIFAKMFSDEIKDEGLKSRTKRFLKEHDTSVDDYRKLLSDVFKGTIPDEVCAILTAIERRLSILKKESKNSCLTPLFTAAKMASTLSEIRALNHILGK